MSTIRLCFQVFVQGKGKLIPLKPVVSEPIQDKKSLFELSISALSSCSCSVDGGKEIILLCDKVVREDIEIVFFEVDSGWEGNGVFQPTDVHKNYAIKFKTPVYQITDIIDPVQVSFITVFGDQFYITSRSLKVFVMLRRPSDGATSKPLEFEYYPSKKGIYKRLCSSSL